MSEQSLFERLGGVYGIAGAVDVLVDRLYANASANANPAVAAFHELRGHAGFKFLVTAWSVEKTGGPACYPGKDMKRAHADLGVSDHDFDVVALEIRATLSWVGVPPAELEEFMAIIEAYRPAVRQLAEDTSTPSEQSTPTPTAEDVAEHGRQQPASVG